MPGLCCQTVSDDAVELWADRALSDFNRKVGRNAPSKQKALGFKKIWISVLTPTLFKNNRPFESPIMLIFSLPCQKMSQRDQAGMLELLQNCCLMNHIWPLLQGYLGEGKELENIMAQWRLGNLGCAGFAKISKRVYFWNFRFQQWKVMWNLNSTSQTAIYGVMSVFLGSWILGFPVSGISKT